MGKTKGDLIAERVAIVTGWRAIADEMDTHKLASPEWNDAQAKIKPYFELHNLRVENNHKDFDPSHRDYVNFMYQGNRKIAKLYYRDREFAGFRVIVKTKYL